MKKRSGWFAIMRNLSFLTQFGLSVASPLVFALLIATWLSQKFGIGTWIYLVAIVLGIGAGACAFFEFIKLVQRQADKKPEDSDV